MKRVREYGWRDLKVDVYDEWMMSDGLAREWYAALTGVDADIPDVFDKGWYVVLTVWHGIEGNAALHCLSLIHFWKKKVYRDKNEFLDSLAPQRAGSEILKVSVRYARKPQMKSLEAFCEWVKKRLGEAEDLVADLEGRLTAGDEKPESRLDFFSTQLSEVLAALSGPVPETLR